MNIQRLSWAGIKLTLGNTQIVIDALTDTSAVEQLLGQPLEKVVSLDATETIDLALVTHIHPTTMIQQA